MNTKHSSDEIGGVLNIAIALVLIVGVAWVGVTHILALFGVGHVNDGVPRIALVSHSCEANRDGSVHVRGALRNSGAAGPAIVKFSLTLYGGQTETARPFLGYDVPGGNVVSYVGHTFSVPLGATPVDCAVSIEHG